MADLTLGQLLATPTADQIRERIFARLNRNDFPIDDFEDGGTVRTVAESESEALLDFVANAIPRIAAGGLALSAAGDWLRLLAQQNFLIDYREASYTVMKVTLTVAVGAGPYTVNPGELVVEAQTGNRYTLMEAGTLPSGASTPLLFKAESPGSAYADGAGTITKLVTSLPGVTISNDNDTFSQVSHQGTGGGVVVVSGIPTGKVRFSLRITSSGAAGTATFEVSKDGALYVPGGSALASPATVSLGSGVLVSFIDGPTPSASFIAGDIYVFSAPGSPVIEQGRDEESDPALQQRMLERWAALAEVPNDDVYAMWAKTASAEVTKVSVWPANTAATPGRVRVVIAGAVNPLPGSTVALVTAYIDQRHPMTDHPVVEAADPVEVKAAGTVLVPAALRDAIQVAAELEWSTYLSQLPMGAKIYSARLELALLKSGATDTTGVVVMVPDLSTHNAYQLEPGQVAQKSAVPLTTLLTWQVH